jgi:hypothetical protein
LPEKPPVEEKKRPSAGLERPSEEFRWALEEF